MSLDVVRLQTEPIDMTTIHDAVRDPRCGAICCFEGTAREVHDGRQVVSLSYEAYHGMAERTLAQVAADTRARFPGVVRMCLVHRLGDVALGQASVAVAVSTPHRGESFEACRFAIDALKASAPIWKKESYGDGSDPRWIANRGTTGAEVNR